jgi:hypothetical protein
VPSVELRHKATTNEREGAAASLPDPRHCRLHRAEQ